MAQTIEAFVGNALDEAKISPLHRRVIGLIAAGYFCDVIDFTILGALIPFIIKSGFTTPAEAAIIGSSAIFGMALGTADAPGGALVHDDDGPLSASGTLEAREIPSGTTHLLYPRMAAEGRFLAVPMSYANWAACMSVSLRL